MSYVKPPKAASGLMIAFRAIVYAPPMSLDRAMIASRDRTYLMDVLRDQLASWVVMHHIVLSSGFDLNAYPWQLMTHHGQEAVLVFFMLSGFAIIKSLYVRPQHWSSFLIARF